MTPLPDPPGRPAGSGTAGEAESAVYGSRDLEATLAAHRLPVRQVSETLPDVHGRDHRLTLLLAVECPNVDGVVLVRWRVPEYPTGWVWRCVTCSVKTRDAHACRHTFAAALHLATTLLGLQALGVVNTHPTPDPEGHAA